MMCFSTYYCHICDNTTPGTHYDHRRNEDHKVHKLINVPKLTLFYAAEKQTNYCFDVNNDIHLIFKQY